MLNHYHNDYRRTAHACNELRPLYQVAVAHFFYFYTADVKVRAELGIMSGLKLYEDALSPVCRSVMLFLSMNSIPHELVHVSLKDRKSSENRLLFTGSTILSPVSLLPR